MAKGKAFLWEPIKLQATREFYHKAGGRGESVGCSIGDTNSFYAVIEAIRGEKFRHPVDILREWIDYGCKMIEAWDIRCVKKLVELFPSCVPTCYHNMPITCDTDDEGRWWVIFGTPGLE